MVLDLVIIGLAITLEPLTIVAFILILGTQQGLRKGLAFILGWTACLVAVIAVVVLVTGGKPPEPHTAPSTAALVVKALLGALLIWVGLRQRRRMGRPRKQPGWMARLDHLSPWAAAGLGAFLQPWTLVAAGAATVVQAKLTTAGAWLALVFSACSPRRLSWSWNCTRPSRPLRPGLALSKPISGSTPTKTRRSWWGR